MANPFLVLGGIAVGIVTAAFGILQVPGWVASAQDAAAINDLSIIRSAQAAEVSSAGTFAPSLAALSASGNGTDFTLSSNDRITLLAVDEERTQWCGVAQSDSGLFFAGSNETVSSSGHTDMQQALLGISCDWANAAQFNTTTLAFTIDTNALACTTPGISLGAVEPDAIIDWGDGTPERAATKGNNTHAYATAGEYQVTIDGHIPEVADGALGTTRCITSIDYWGEKTGTTTTRSAFIGAISLGSVAQPPSTVTSMKGMFEGTSEQLTGLSGWDTSNVEDMERMFSSSGFNGDIRDWDTSHVTTMNQMFSNSGFNQAIGDWDVRAVKNFYSMFGGAANFNQPLDGWEPISATDFSSMFEFTTFNQDISGWNVSSAQKMDAMFSWAMEFDRDISGWDVSKVTSFSGFADGSALTKSSIPLKFR